MASIRIPGAALPGFGVISRLDNGQIEQITGYLEQMRVGTKMEEIETFLSSVLESIESTNVVRTLISFSDLLQRPNVDFKALASNLASSYQVQSEEEVDEEEREALNNNLYKIFEKSSNLKLTLKAIDLVNEDNYLFTGNKIVTDIRLVFNDEIEDKNRNALLIHHLHLEYFKEGPKKIILELDLSDLKKLKTSIERAINKEEIIKADYQHVINFLNLSNDV